MQRACGQLPRVQLDAALPQGRLKEREHLSVPLLLSTTIVPRDDNSNEASECRAPAPLPSRAAPRLEAPRPGLGRRGSVPDDPRQRVERPRGVGPHANSKQAVAEDHPVRATVVEGRTGARHARRIGVVLCVAAAAGPASPSREAHCSSARQADHGGSAANGRVATVRRPPVRTGPWPRRLFTDRVLLSPCTS